MCHCALIVCMCVGVCARVCGCACVCACVHACACVHSTLHAEVFSNLVRGTKELLITNTPIN